MRTCASGNCRHLGEGVRLTVQSLKGCGAGEGGVSKLLVEGCFLPPLLGDFRVE